MKDLYFEADMNIVEFDCEDVIATSAAFIPPDIPTNPDANRFW